MADHTAGGGSSRLRGYVVIIEERCKGCAFCQAFCPTGALEMSDRMNRAGYHLPVLRFPEKCNGCDLCGMYCPDFAIRGVRNRPREDV
jgi:2-oxoglutarate ferredoxin oxidoreductase subunit delta